MFIIFLDDMGFCVERPDNKGEGNRDRRGNGRAVTYGDIIIRGYDNWRDNGF